jgi:hypothetical protein
MRCLLLTTTVLTACNTAPGALQITLGPAEPHTTTDLVAELSGDFTDPDSQAHPAL